MYDFGGLFRWFVVWVIWIRIKNKNDLNEIRIRLSMSKIFSSILFQFLETSDSGFEGVRARLCEMKVLKLILILNLISLLSYFYLFVWCNSFNFVQIELRLRFFLIQFELLWILINYYFILHSDSNYWNSNIGIFGFRLFLRLKC